ncbi:MAG: RnfABCDGE type electron transport complex subunit B [Oscillospiraceae bacterium]|nr:RnfABCDGE type electron transport complex subunit B [Oscillospiraceae bacterium]
MNGILTTVIIVAAIGIIASVVLVVAAKVMYVYEDERIGQVAGCLPGANCGGCGYAGCSDYAKAIVEKGADLDKCAPGGADCVKAIAKVMGVSASAGAAKKAVVKCQGHTCNTGTKFDYQGVTTCSAAAKMFGGPGDCAYGCLGLGDCASACPFGAIQVVDGVARVINEKCTGCGACAKVCPKFVIEIVEDDVKPMVLCNNKDNGKLTREACKVGCIGCKRCEKVCPIETAKAKAVTVDGFLANIDADLCIGCMQCAEACPVGAIDVPNCR